MFKVQKAEESVTRTFRLPKILLDKMSDIAQNENVSLNSFVVQCCQYAVENIETPSLNNRNQN